MSISKQALAALDTLKGLEAEGVGALAATLKGELEAIDAKNFTVIGEKRVETQRKQALEAALSDAAKALGVEGDQEVLISGVPGAARTLTADKDAAIKAKAAAEGKLTTSTAELEKLKTDAKRSAIAQKASVDPVIFGDLFGSEDLEKFEIAEDGAVSYDGKPFRKYVQSDERLKRYDTALFSAKDPKPAPKTPPGAPPKDETPDLMANYLSNTYAA